MLRGADGAKDQSYFLFALSQEQLAHTVFPLGAMQKSAVRAKARALNLPAAERPESQDICFGDYKALVATYAKESELDGGEVVDRSGKAARPAWRHAQCHRRAAPRFGHLCDASRFTSSRSIKKSNRVVVGNKNELSSAGLVARAVQLDRAAR